MFESYSSEVNSLLFYAHKVIFVEGESDSRVLKVLLKKRFHREAYRYSVISASGNKNFSPFLRMTRAWSTARIPHLVVTDFDSLTKGGGHGDRAILTGAKDAGYTTTRTEKTAFISQVDAAIDKSEDEFGKVAVTATQYFKNVGLSVFVFTSDLEYSLITTANRAAAVDVLNSLAGNGADYGQGYNIDQLRRQIGSKGVPLNPMQQPPFKKPFIHQKIAETIDLNSAHADIDRLLDAIERL